MTDEPKKRQNYGRRPYDSAKHCGFPKDRSMDTVIARKAKYEARLADYTAIEAERPFTNLEKKRIGKLGALLAIVKSDLASLEKYGPDDRPCVNAKGQRTTHPGVGHCRMHCECKGRPNWHLGGDKFSYSRRAHDKRLKELIDEMDAANHDVLDLEPDVLLIRAKIKLFLDDKQDFDPETVRSFTLLADQLRKVVETINDKRFKASISLETFNLIQYRMAEVLMRYITDPEILEKISGDWAKIAVETSAKKNRALAAGAIDVGVE